MTEKEFCLKLISKCKSVCEMRYALYHEKADMLITCVDKLGEAIELVHEDSDLLIVDLKLNRIIRRTE